jgi:proline iminopeptidase
MSVPLPPDPSVPQEGYAPVENGALFYRQVGDGQPILLLHGGPDFDHTYLLPDMDRLSDACRLVYYDQRGRGKSGPEPRPDDVTIQTEIQDLEGLRKYLQLDKVAVLGHSWGGYLAMEYAIRHPDRVSHLMNTGPASHEDFLLFQHELRRRKGVYEAELNALVSSAAFQKGDPEAVAAYYRIHFATTIQRPDSLERLLKSLRASLTKENILRGRAIEACLFNETWLSPECDLFPRLKQLRIPTLVLHGEDDFIPAVCATHIAETIPGARFVLLRGSGHFAYIESPEEVRQEIGDFYASQNHQQRI